MIEAKDCPYGNVDWYDVTDIETAKQGKNSKVCVNLDCHEDCSRIVTTEGLPFYDRDGQKVRQSK